jgi:flavodoxin
MKALILFRSHYGNTQHVAETMARQITASGYEVVVQDLRQKLPDPQAFDFFLIGAPTRMAGVTSKALSIIKQLKKKGIGDKPIAIFDTYGPLPTKPEDIEKSKKWFYPGAAGRMHKFAEDMGLNVYQEALRCNVKEFKGPLAEGQVEKAEAFARQFLSTIGKKS